MKTIKQLLTTIAVLLCSVVANAQVFEVDGIFYNITSEKELTVEVTYKGFNYYDYDEYKGTIEIPATVICNEQQYNVTSIGSDAFRNCYSLRSITIPNRVTSIGRSAFNGCRSLTSVTISESVTSIGWDIFYECDSLSSLNIIAKSIEDYCNRMNDNNGIHKSFFHRQGKHLIINNEEIKNVIIPEGVDSIGSYALYSCPNLISITIPKSVTSIGDNAFARCDSISTVIWNAKDCSVPYSKYSPSSIFTNFNT